MVPVKRKINLFLPSIADVIFLSLFLILVFKTGSGLLRDGDTGYHIRAGEFIIENLSVPKQDIFSFHSPAPKWTAHEWLSEVIMATVHDAAGLTGIVIFFSLIIALTFSLLFKTLRPISSNIIFVVLVVLLVTASSSIHWLARPHILSLLLTLLWYCLLDSFQYKNKNLLYFLPLMTLLWVNLHAGFIIGILLLGIYFSGNLAIAAWSQGEIRLEHWSKAKLLGVTLFACVIVSLLNPYGYHILWFPFELTSDKFLMAHVNEFLSPNFHAPLPFKYLLFVTLGTLAISRLAVNPIELILIVLFTYMSLYSARYIPLFSIIIAPILVRQIDGMLTKANEAFVTFLKKRSTAIAATDTATMGYLWPGVGVLAVLVFTANGTIAYHFDSSKMPVDAVEFLKKEQLQGNMFNNDEFGDYIIYSAWPNYKVFLDGRSDMYGTEKLQDYLKVLYLRSNWDEVLKKYDIQWVIYKANSPLATLLSQRQDWRLVYADKIANIFVRNIPQYEPLLIRYPNVQPVIDEDNSGRSKLSARKSY